MYDPEQGILAPLTPQTLNGGQIPTEAAQRMNHAARVGAVATSLFSPGIASSKQYPADERNSPQIQRGMPQGFNDNGMSSNQWKSDGRNDNQNSRQAQQAQQAQRAFAMQDNPDSRAFPGDNTRTTLLIVPVRDSTQNGGRAWLQNPSYDMSDQSTLVPVAVAAPVPAAREITTLGVGPGGPMDLSYVNEPDYIQWAQQDAAQDTQGGPGQYGMMQSRQGPGLSVLSPNQQTQIQPNGVRINTPNSMIALGRADNMGMGFGNFGFMPQGYDVDHPVERDTPMAYNGAASMMGPPPLAGKIALPPNLFANTATGNVINSGSTARGMLSANGNSKTRTGPFGSLSSGQGQLAGSGLGIQGTSVNSAGASTNGGFPGGYPGASNANAMFINSMNAAKGTVNGMSDTLSHTGPNGNAMSRSGGSAFGQGEGITLTQLANSDSNSQSFGPDPAFDGSDQSHLWQSQSIRQKRDIPTSWSSMFGVGNDAGSNMQPVIVYQNGTFPGSFGVMTRFDPQSGTITQMGGASTVFSGPGISGRVVTTNGISSFSSSEFGSNPGSQTIAPLVKV